MSGEATPPPRHIVVTAQGTRLHARLDTTSTRTLCGFAVHEPRRAGEPVEVKWEDIDGLRELYCERCFPPVSR